MTQNHSTIRNNWDQHWQDYAAASVSNPAQAYRRNLIISLLKEDSTPQRILDVGSGQGDMAQDLCAIFPEATILGLELSASGIEESRRKVPRAKFIQRDLEATAEPEPDFLAWATHAVCSEVLEHLQHPKVLLKNLSQYLAPSARLIVTVPGGPMSAFDKHIGHLRHFTCKTLRQLLMDTGFTVEFISGAGFPFFNLYRALVILRGKQLIKDVSIKNGRAASAPALLAMRMFNKLFMFNLNRSRFGWQIIASARMQSTRST